MFEYKRDSMYHMPHNTAILDEFLFLIENIDISKKFYSFSELSKLLIINEFKQNKFQEYHPTPFKNLLKIDPDLFNKFKTNSEKYYDKFMNIKYSSTKTWKQNWVEFARDYVDFAAYIGLLPCYFKTPGRKGVSDGYLVSEQLIKYRNKKISFSNLLMDYKYSNSSINIKRFNQFNIKVRPFYLGLCLLNELKSRGVKQLERRLFFASIACANNENIKEIADVVTDWISKNDNILNKNNHSDKFQKEAGRVATGMQDFYLKTGLLTRKRSGTCHYFSITDKGFKVMSETPRNAMFYGNVDSESGLFYSPLLANLLNKFLTSSKEGLQFLSKNKLYNSFTKLDEKTFNLSINYIQELKPSPISKIDDDQIYLNDFSHQYHVVPYNDFSDENDIKFIESGEVNTPSEQFRVDSIEFPDDDILNELKNAAYSSDGGRYEEAIYNALRLLPGTCQHYGSSFSGQRYSDVVWKVSMPTPTGNKYYLVVIEAKAGSAIKSFNERNAIPQIINTVDNYKSDFKNIEGIWYMVLDSNKLPRENSHGGARKDGTKLKFSQKLYKIQEQINNNYGRTTLVTAFGIEAFIEYYKYLYAFSRPTFDEDCIRKIYIQQFFNDGGLFTKDFSVKSLTLLDPEDLKNSLNYGA